jgi:sec-independent protein translocase protein TatA
MFDGRFQPMHPLILAGIALLIFGPKRLPELGKGLGDGLGGFKAAMNPDVGKPEEPKIASALETKTDLETKTQEGQNRRTGVRLDDSGRAVPCSGRKVSKIHGSRSSGTNSEPCDGRRLLLNDGKALDHLADSERSLSHSVFAEIGPPVHHRFNGALCRDGSVVIIKMRASG